MIKLKDVYFSNDNKDILKNINLEIEQGKSYLLLGASGSGKSSLLKILNNLYSPTSGKIFYKNNDYQSFKPHFLRRNIALIMQDPILFGKYVYENFEFLSKIIKKEIKRDYILDLFDSFGLKKDYYNKKNFELSGGEKYRISIIRTLLLNPEFILTDEPFAALDKNLMKRIFLFLKNFSMKKEKGLIVVSHTFDDIISDFDSVLFMKNGFLEIFNSPDKFIASEKAYIKAFLEGRDE